MSELELLIYDTYRIMYNMAKKNAKIRRIPFDLTQEDYKKMIAKADGHCSVTGLAFEFTARNGKKRPWCPSLDRINSDEGYSLKNCRLVCVAVNLAMNEWGVEILNRIGAQYVRVGGFPAQKASYMSSGRFASEHGLAKEQIRKLGMRAGRICDRLDLGRKFESGGTLYPLEALEQAYEEIRQE